eukprot:gene19280-25138_t
MPVKKGNKINKKPSHRISDEDDHHEQFLDAHYNPDAIQSLLFELGKQVESKCNHIQNDSNFMITSIQEAFHLELIKLPTQVKKMSLARFREEFGDSLEAVTRGTMIGNDKSNQSIPFNKSRNNRQSMLFQTPMAKSHNIIAETPSTRYPKEGEMIVSANGSPLGVFNTVVKAKNPATLTVPATPGVYLPLKSGDVIDIDSINIDTLTDEIKQDALSKMQDMMSNMQKLMDKLESTTTVHV